MGPLLKTLLTRYAKAEQDEPNPSDGFLQESFEDGIRVYKTEADLINSLQIYFGNSCINDSQRCGCSNCNWDEPQEPSNDSNPLYGDVLGLWDRLTHEEKVLALYGQTNEPDMTNELKYELSEVDASDLPNYITQFTNILNKRK